jgi:hypothetical protein
MVSTPREHGATIRVHAVDHGRSSHPDDSAYPRLHGKAAQEFQIIQEITRFVGVERHDGHLDRICSRAGKVAPASTYGA